MLARPCLLLDALNGPESDPSSDPQWTSDADIVHLAGLAGLEVPFKDVVFAEHKVNGKSKGCVPLALCALSSTGTD